MLDSTQLAQMMQQFESQNGPVETHPIIQRDYMNPNGSFMMSSANDAPKMHTRTYSAPATEAAIAVMQEHKGLSTAEIMSKSGSSRVIVQAAARAMSYKLASRKRGPKTSVTGAILAAANSLPLEQRTIKRVSRIAKTSRLYASKIMRENGIQTTRSKKGEK